MSYKKKIRCPLNGPWNLGKKDSIMPGNSTFNVLLYLFIAFQGRIIIPTTDGWHPSLSVVFRFCLTQIKNHSDLISAIHQANSLDSPHIWPLQGDLIKMHILISLFLATVQDHFDFSFFNSEQKMLRKRYRTKCDLSHGKTFQNEGRKPLN